VSDQLCNQLCSSCDARGTVYTLQCGLHADIGSQPQSMVAFHG
jgi:hypothetical protein